MNVCHIKKDLLTILLFFLTVVFSCSDNSTGPADSNPLVGTWNISTMITIYEGEIETFNESQLKEIGVIWTLIIKDDDTIEQITNLSGPLITMPGTWSASENQIVIILKGPTGTSGTMVYNYKIEDDILNLNWQIPAGTEFFAEFTKIK